MPNPSNYPNALDDLSTNLTDSFVEAGGPGGGHPGLHNEQRAAINAIQQTMGLDPAGGYDTVAERVAALEA